LILPGMMNTPMVHAPGVIAAYGGGVEEMVRQRDELCPMGRMGDACDVAHALCSSHPTRPVPSWASMAG
jgi:NAD(P)-dependent dehydrogenase (short-subunit alcohol dehydrogenase family)